MSDDESIQRAERNHYDVLDIGPDATVGEVRDAYEKGLALVRGETTGGYLMLDPDAAGDAEGDLAEALDVLSDPERRRAWHVAAGLPPPPAEALAPSGGKSTARAALRFLKPVDKSGLAPPKGTSGKNLAAPGEDDAQLDLPDDDAPQVQPRRTASGSIIRIATAVESTPPQPASGEDSDIPEGYTLSTAPTAPPQWSTTGDLGALQANAPEIDLNPTLITQPKSARPADSSRPASASDIPADTPVDGAFIRALRDAKGYTVEDVAKKTHIQKRFIIAIEAVDPEALPARVYIRGFLTQMARVLGVSKKDLSTGYLKTLDGIGYPDP